MKQIPKRAKTKHFTGFKGVLLNKSRKAASPVLKRLLKAVGHF